MLVWDHWHIEISSICALKCPRCPRTEVPESLLNRQLSLEFFQRQICAEVLSDVNKITFCGNDGDPIYCKDFLDICAWIKTVNPDIKFTIITNGSYRSTNWWAKLAGILNVHDEIVWSIDGWDQHSNSQYRINSDWASIMSGMKEFARVNQHSYRVWASIAFRFNQDHLDHMKDLAAGHGMDLFQLTKSTKFGSHYPEIYGTTDPLCPDRKDLTSSNLRFERVLNTLTNKPRPADRLKTIYLSRVEKLQGTAYSGLCLVGNKGVFINSQGEFYPCCWTANRYDHNRAWHRMASTRFNLWNHTWQEIIDDPFWSTDFLKFDSKECVTKCTPERLKDPDHTTQW